MIQDPKEEEKLSWADSVGEVCVYICLYACMEHIV